MVRDNILIVSISGDDNGIFAVGVRGGRCMGEVAEHFEGALIMVD
jgi:hypothetical protein